MYLDKIWDDTHTAMPFPSLLAFIIRKFIHRIGVYEKHIERRDVQLKQRFDQFLGE
jgi:hypothetical protein